MVENAFTQVPYLSTILSHFYWVVPFYVTYLLNSTKISGGNIIHFDSFHLFDSFISRYFPDADS